MFDQSFVDGGGAAIKPWAVAASLVGQCLLVGTMVLIPLVYTNELPVEEWLRNTVLLAPPPPPPPPVAEPVNARVVPEAPKRFEPVLHAPAVIPDEVAIVDPLGSPDGIEAPSLAGLAGGVVGGVLGGVPGGIAGREGPTVLPPPPIRVGGTVQAARILRRVMPLYPPEASEQGIGGTVRLEAIITAEGLVRDISVLEGHPFLIESAVTAVEQWRYRPTRLNDVPVEVITFVDIVFKPLPPEELEKRKRLQKKNKKS